MHHAILHWHMLESSMTSMYRNFPGRCTCSSGTVVYVHVLLYTNRCNRWCSVPTTFFCKNFACVKILWWRGDSIRRQSILLLLTFAVSLSRLSFRQCSEERREKRQFLMYIPNQRSDRVSTMLTYKLVNAISQSGKVHVSAKLLMSNQIDLQNARLRLATSSNDSKISSKYLQPAFPVRNRIKRSQV